MADKLIFKFETLKGTTISAIEQSPVINIVAVGYASGVIEVLNLLYNEKVMKFEHDRSPVMGFAFSSDTTMQ